MRTYPVRIISILDNIDLNSRLGDTINLYNKEDPTKIQISIELRYKKILWFRMFAGLDIVLNPYKFGGK